MKCKCFNQLSIFMATYWKSTIEIWRFYIFFPSLLAIETLKNHFIFRFLILNFSFRRKFASLRKKGRWWQRTTWWCCVAKGVQKNSVLTLDWSVVASRHKNRQWTYQGEAVGSEIKTWRKLPCVVFSGVGNVMPNRPK